MIIEFSPELDLPITHLNIRKVNPEIIEIYIPENSDIVLNSMDIHLMYKDRKLKLHGIDKSNIKVLNIQGLILPLFKKELLDLAILKSWSLKRLYAMC